MEEIIMKNFIEQFGAFIEELIQSETESKKAQKEFYQQMQQQMYISKCLDMFRYEFFMATFAQHDYGILYVASPVDIYPYFISNSEIELRIFYYTSAPLNTAILNMLRVRLNKDLDDYRNYIIQCGAQDGYGYLMKDFRVDKVNYIDAGFYSIKIKFN